MTYKKINNITGWAVFLIAAIVYIMTMEPNGSLWDCGEFAGSAARMGVPHPPGAPMFIIIGRIFAIIGKTIGIGEGGGVALSSALSSAFTILFLFWTITHFAKKIKNRNDNEASKGTPFDIMAAGVIGALAYTFSDSFWYSAVESEVYAMSSLCTAVVFWAALKWEDHPENNDAAGIDGKNRADKWMILIFFLMGMSIGVHLLNILTIPPIILIYYFKRYKQSNLNLLIALFVSVLILGFVQKVVGQYSIEMAFPFERFFVNDLSLPVLSGFIFFFVLLGVGFFFLLRFANKNNYGTLRLATWCLAFILIGMSTYMTTMIRSRANPGIDMYNVDNPYALKGYLSREQYGDFPLLYGQHYEAESARDDNGNQIITKTGDRYVLRKDEDGKLKYIKSGENREGDFVSSDKMLFPRIWYSNEENRKQFYRQWLNPKFEVYDRLNYKVEEVFDNQQEADQSAAQKNQMAKQNVYRVRDHLTYAKNMNWFFTYQFDWMYFRYFMWNFAGKQNDVQGFSSKRDGNWISGISMIDNARLGDQSAMPDSLKNNKANNKLYFLPLILGLIGFVYQLRKQKKDIMVTSLLFLMTGFAIVLYLNQYGLQPRERDYAYVGSFYAFAIWIGLGYLQVKDWLAKAIKGLTPSVVAAAICFIAVPMLMLNQEWDDHNRSQKTLARDLAKDYLESCPKDAILFTIGDNDTYPLWYAQEVEGVRKDIRVVNTSLLGIDWYLDQLKYKVNESPAFNMVWKSEDYEGPKMEYAFEKQSPLFNTATPMPLDSFLKVAPTLAEGGDFNQQYFFPGRAYSLNVDVAKASKLFNLASGDTLASQITSNINPSKQILTKGDFGIFNILAANINDRAICFTDNNGADLGALGIQPFLRRQGMVYQFIPSNKFKKVETNTSQKTMMSTFAFGNAATKGVYYDEENRRHLESIRESYIRIADALNDEGKPEDAKKLLRRVHEQMPSYSLPYGIASRGEMNNSTSLDMVRSAYMAKDDALGKEIFDEVSKDVMQQMKYYYTLSNPNGNATKENVDEFIKEFSELYALSSRRITQEENIRAGALQEKIFKNKLTGFTVQDAYGNMRNYSTMNQLKDVFVQPKAQTDPKLGETGPPPIIQSTAPNSKDTPKKKN
jgi:Protein of unknown function (DUF2723)